MRKWTIHHFYNQYLHTLWLAFLLLTSCNTGEMIPIILQANPGMVTLDTLQANPSMITKDSTYFIRLFLQGIATHDLNRVILGKIHGAPIEALDKYGYTSLIEAVKAQNIEVIYYLLQQRADTNQKNQVGYAPLHYAVRGIENCFGRGERLDPRVSLILCSYRANVNIQDHEGNTPLHHAILARADYYHAPQENYTLQKGRIQILLEAGAQSLPNNNGDTPLTLAKSINRSDIVALLEKEGIIKPTISSLGALSKEKLVSYLLSPSNAAQEHEQKIGILYDQLYINLSSKVNIHIDTNFSCGNKLIHRATEAHNLPIIHFLLLCNPHQINYTNLIGQTPLHIAAENGYTEIVQYLVQYPNINLNALSIGGYSPLHYALLHGHNHVVGCLIQSKANVNVTNYFGKTPLHYAAYNSSLELVRYLLQNNANTNVTDYRFIKTPLHYAAENGSLRLVRYLLQNSASINATDYLCKTPLHHAAYNGSFEVVRYLLQKDANINARDIGGNSPLNNASENGRFSIVEYLIHQGATEHEQYDDSVEVDESNEIVDQGSEDDEDK
jgi:ankyrin repeat protein